MKNNINEITRKLVKAYQMKQPIPFLRHQFSLDEKTAYAIQDAFVEKRCKLEDAYVSGYKISMTSDDTQAIADTDEPAYGTLLTTDIVKSGESVYCHSSFHH